MKRKISIGVSLFILIIMMLTFFGCSKEEEINENAILIWANLYDNEVEKVQEIINKWSEENDVEVVMYNTTKTGTNFIETLDSQKPDIFLGASSEDMGRLIKAKTLEEVPLDLFPNDIYVSEDLVQATSIDGIQYGIPITQESVVLYYNKDLVSEVPETMEEVIEIGKEKGFAFEVTNYYFSYGFVASQGGYTYKYDGKNFDYNDLGVNNEGAIKGYKFLQDMVDGGKLFLPGASDYMTSGYFEDGKTAFYIGETGRIRTFNNANKNFGIATIPTVNGKEVTPYKYVKMATVSSASDKKDLSWKLLQAITAESDEIFMKTGPYAPTFKSSLESETFINDEKLQVLYDQCNTSMLLPNNVENEAINMVLGNNLSNLVMGEITPKECGEAIEKEIRETIKEILTYDD